MTYPWLSYVVRIEESVGVVMLVERPVTEKLMLPLVNDPVMLIVWGFVVLWVQVPVNAIKDWQLRVPTIKDGARFRTTEPMSWLLGIKVMVAVTVDLSVRGEKVPVD